MGRRGGGFTSGRSSPAKIKSGETYVLKFVRLCDLLTEYFEQWNSVLPNRGNSTSWTILEFCQGLNDVVVQTSRPVQQCRTFQCTIPQEIGGRLSVRFLLPPRMCLRRAPTLRRTRAPTPRKHPGLFRQPLEYLTIVMATWSAAALTAQNDMSSYDRYAFLTRYQS